MINFYKIIIIVFIMQRGVYGQSVLTIYPDSLLTTVNKNFTPGVFYVPKTASAATDFVNNGIQQNSIRTNVIESVLNNTSNLASCLSLLNTVQSDLQNLSAKTNKLIFIFEKMPGWLSSSTNSSPASTPGWYVLNTKPPANWNVWQTVVDSITSKIINKFGITNAYFEVWNEPDIGSWTGTMTEYFTLYKKTYDGIKSASSSAKVGGPTVNFWANNIYWQPPYGHISNAKADSSLIGQLIDSAVVWNKVPNFISWHNFNLSYQEFANATNYIQQKLASHSLSNIPLIVSEWNAPSQVRDTKLAISFMIKAQLEFSKTTIANNVIAAWQDFNPSTNEFHNDYGLLTYGTIHKPAYNSVLLSQKLNGTTCKIKSTVPYDGIASLKNDTLSVLVSNYCPLPFLEAFNHTLYQGLFNAKQLDSAGYINVAGNNPLRLDSIYKGLITIPNTNAMQIAINNSKSIYKHFDSIATKPRLFKINISGHTGNYLGQFYAIDSTKNNQQFKYDSLRLAGYSQSSAIAAIIPNQQLKYTAITVNAGSYSFLMQPNTVGLLKIKVTGINSVYENNSKAKDFMIYPNPTFSKLTVTFLAQQLGKNELLIYNAIGKLVKVIDAVQPSTSIDISELSNGLYFIYPANYPEQAQKFIKQ
jgi:Glycosyl hydrolases family 39/Secretion system C-terminal sorting domain